ncbi:MAG: dihydroorotase [Butyricicoccus sp.]|nr:dihydroorotase [Butyricicoccus sp.]
MTGIYGAKKYCAGGFSDGPLFIDNQFVAENARDCDAIENFDGCYILPGFADVHVHLREPGFSYKETIGSGTRAAARGGYTVVCAMPNLSPVPDCAENLAVQLEAIERDAVVRVLPYGAISRGEKGQELADLDALSPAVVAFSDDGKGVQSDGLMRRAMLKAKALGKIIAAHCEDESLLHGGCIHDGQFAAGHGLPGICSESEWRQLERDLCLVRETGCAYHMCHVSTKESVELIRRAKAEGLDVSCETAPHYLLLSDAMLRDEGRFKMNPPVRSEDDRLALLEGIKDGTVDMIATDHAPHSAEEKGRGLRGSLMGVVGLEAAFPVLYTGLVRTGEISLERLVELMCVNPRRRFALPGGLEPGDEADFCVVDLNEKFSIDSRSFLSMGKATPFDGMEVYGRVKYTAVKGEVVWQSK